MNLAGLPGFLPAKVKMLVALSEQQKVIKPICLPLITIQDFIIKRDSRDQPLNHLVFKNLSRLELLLKGIVKWILPYKTNAILPNRAFKIP